MGIEDVTGRIARDLEHLKQYTATPGNGCTRLPFTKEARDAVNYLKELMTEAGLEVTEDAAGNVIGTLKGEDPDAPCVMMGSHYDSVVNGGDYDGISELGHYDEEYYKGLVIRIGDRTMGNSIDESVEEGQNVTVSGKIDASWCEYYKQLYVECQSLSKR